MPNNLSDNLSNKHSLAVYKRHMSYSVLKSTCPKHLLHIFPSTLRFPNFKICFCAHILVKVSSDRNLITIYFQEKIQLTFSIDLWATVDSFFLYQLKTCDSKLVPMISVFFFDKHDARLNCWLSKKCFFFHSLKWRA